MLLCYKDAQISLFNSTLAVKHQTRAPPPPTGQFDHEILSQLQTGSLLALTTGCLFQEFHCSQFNI